MTSAPHSELPNLFQFQNGDLVRTAADWQRRRRELSDLIVQLEYGGLPPAPPALQVEDLHISSPMKRFDNARYITSRITIGTARPFSFILNLHMPAGNGPFPVILTGDACWRNASDEVISEILRRGYILAQFNRVEIVPDVYRTERDSGLYLVYPEGTFGALAAWAWGYHRAIDALLTKEYVQPGQIAVVGHSRGGKTVLLAGATDERIAVVGANNSGSGGAGCYRRQGPDSETLAHSMRRLSYWYGPRLKEYVGKEDDLPFDQHVLKALIAPRALVMLEGRDDLWCNPTGAWLTTMAARELYRFLGAEDALGTWYRDGGHGHNFVDWQAFLEFTDWRFRGRSPCYRYDLNPYPELPPAHTWTAPA